PGLIRRKKLRASILARGFLYTPHAYANGRVREGRAPSAQPTRRSPTLRTGQSSRNLRSWPLRWGRRRSEAKQHREQHPRNRFSDWQVPLKSSLVSCPVGGPGLARSCERCDGQVHAQPQKIRTERLPRQAPFRRHHRAEGQGGAQTRQRLRYPETHGKAVALRSEARVGRCDEELGSDPRAEPGARREAARDTS